MIANKEQLDSFKYNSEKDYEPFRKVVHKFSKIEEDHIFEWDSDIKEIKIESDSIISKLDIPKAINVIADGEKYNGEFEKQ